MESKSLGQPVRRSLHTSSAGEFDRVRADYRGLVATEIRRRLHGLEQSDFEDIEQTIWIAVWKSLRGFHGGSSLSTWIVGITKNQIHSWLRQRLQEQSYQSQLSQASGDEKSFEVDLTARITLEDAIRSLVPAEKEVIKLRYFEGLTDTAISNRLHLPLGTVKSRIRAGVADLRASM